MTTLDTFLKEQLNDPEFKKAYTDIVREEFKKANMAEFQVLHCLPTGKDTVVEVGCGEDYFHEDMSIWDELGEEYRIIGIGMANYRNLPKSQGKVDLIIEGKFRSAGLYVKL